MKFILILKPVRVVTFVFVLISLLACCMDMKHEMKTDNTGHGAGVVWIKFDKFSPGSITVPVNTTVTWTNRDWWPHTVTSDAGLFESEKIKSGKSFKFKFSVRGTYKYHCTIHDMMVGNVIVQ